eukprot:39273-Eustigmatos_ZCMA.PRE.1
MRSQVDQCECVSYGIAHEGISPAAHIRKPSSSFVGIPGRGWLLGPCRKRPRSPPWRSKTYDTATHEAHPI